MKTYGHFETDNSYLITDPHTPEAWLHYLIRPGQAGTETFCSGVSHAGGGFDIRGTHENTITDTKMHLHDGDEMGRYVYIKDCATGEIFTTSWQPLRPEGHTFTTRFSFGKIDFEGRYKEIETKVEMIVPECFDGWLQNISIRNNSLFARDIEVYPFIPVHMGDALARLLAGDNDAFFGGASFDRDLKGIVYRRNHGIAVNDNQEKINGMLGNVVLFYSTLNSADTEYETDLEGFFGDRFHDQKNPLSIERSRLRSVDTSHLRRSCGVFRHIVHLEPGETLDFAIALIAGSTADYYLNGKKELKKITDLVNSPGKRAAMISGTTLWWKERLSLLRIHTPLPEINRAFPWLQYQCEIVLVLNRMKSRFHTGYEYGWGFRDILQDILYLLPYRPNDMEKILSHVSTQIFTRGQVYHNFFITQEGNKSIEASDDPLWFVQAVIALCRETGDFSFLQKITNYAEAREKKATTAGTILEHCIRCLSRALEDRSERELPFMKDCDWNDDLNERRIDDVPSRAMESIMAAQQLYGALTAFSELLEKTGGHASAVSAYRETASRIQASLASHAFDREGYFKRALACEAGGSDLGSSENEEAKIFLESQVFGINCGCADEAQSAAILDAVELYLDTDRGAMLCWPFFNALAERNELPHKTWNIEKEPPGMKENGGVFMHLNAWLVESYCRTGKGNKAVALFRKTLPENMSRDQDAYKAEPYVYPEYVRGKGIREEGRGGHTWLTGTAPTMHTALTEFIFGVRAEYEGLRIDPCVDASWDRFTVKRSFRNAVYSITFDNPSHVESGVMRVTADGKNLDGNLVPSFADGKEHAISVTMG